MLNAARSEVVRLVALVVRRVDAELAEAAARNAESGVQAHRQRWAEEVRTLRELQAVESRRLQLPVAG
jgi:phosphoribosylanthranilate isomerase